jgi:hypothetical protein
MITVRIYDDEDEEGYLIEINPIMNTDNYDYRVIDIPSSPREHRTGTLYNFGGSIYEIAGVIISGGSVS